MTIPYRIIGRIHPGKPEAPRKYYPVVRSRGRRNTRDLAEEISRRSTMSSADTIGLFQALFHIISEYLLQGYVVDLGEIGSFSVRVRASGADTPGEVSPRKIRNLLISFRASKQFKSTLQKAAFRKVKE